jgi:hypothetical protein
MESNIEMAEQAARPLRILQSLVVRPANLRIADRLDNELLWGSCLLVRLIFVFFIEMLLRAINPNVGHVAGGRKRSLIDPAITTQSDYLKTADVLPACRMSVCIN